MCALPVVAMRYLTLEIPLKYSNTQKLSHSWHGHWSFVNLPTTGYCSINGHAVVVLKSRCSQWIVILNEFNKPANKLLNINSLGNLYSENLSGAEICKQRVLISTLCTWVLFILGILFVLCNSIEMKIVLVFRNI